MQVTRDPLLPWKTSLRTLRKARDLGMEVVVGLDVRSSAPSLAAVSDVAHRVIVFDTQDEWPEGQLNAVLDAGNREWAFLVSDDEEPSEDLWRFATRVPDLKDPDGQHYLWRCRMLAPLPDWSAHYQLLDTYQPRYFPRESIRWPGGFDQMPVSRLTEIDVDLILWHYTLWSPREHREGKVRRHRQAWGESYELHPWPFPADASYLWEDHPEHYLPLNGYARP